MRRRCPTLSELNAFSAAARHLSFSKAGKELFVTQSAISRHIATLESYLGHALFIRGTNGLQLTRMGATYLSLIRPALHTLESATSQVMATQQSAKSLNVSAAPTFAAQWLFPRLKTFREVNPDISINFVRYSVADYKSTELDFDASIQYGYGDWHDGDAKYLTGRETRWSARGNTWNSIPSAASKTSSNARCCSTSRFRCHGNTGFRRTWAIMTGRASAPASICFR